MKVLLLHPEDNPGTGPWRHLRWDRIVDLGLAGANTYASWNEQSRCPVSTLSSLRNGFHDFSHIRSLLGAGCGRLVDNYGLDWWEILSLLLTEQLESVILLQRLAETISADEVYISRPGFQANVLRNLLPDHLQILPVRHNDQSSARHYIRLARKLSVSQIADVFCDKYDPGQQLRARFSRTRQRSGHPVVLVPTAYVNVSRTGIAYANALPQQKFLLVSTRRSGWIKHPPSNVAAAWLSSYATTRDRSVELAGMEIRWRALLKDLLQIPEFEIVNALGFFDRFPQQLRHGLEVRDAWRILLDLEPVQAVLCADDSNPYTRIPLLLARERELPTVACHHGALDGYYALKRTYGDVVLAKGRMEQDYLVQRCRVPADKVQIAAPTPHPAKTDGTKTDRTKKDRTQQPLSNARKQWTRDAFRPQILFISEGYEVGNARAEEFYRDVLPPLAELALHTGRKLIVKLHPAESRNERVRMVKRVLSLQQMRVTQVVAGALTDALLDATWFGVTVLSSVAMECALRSIPCFLCKWLEYSFYGYIDQFIRFGVGIGLNNPSEIMKIPQHLETYEADPGVAANCWQPAAADHLMSLLTSSPRLCATAAT
ncbi:MAG: hypothetical protein WCF22_15830 [Candidatus Sulfotelmatobacter sp.]